MKTKLLIIMKNKWFLGSLIALVVLGAFRSQEIVYMSRQYMAGDVPWSSAPKDLNGRVVFEEHYSMHPGHYTFTEKLGIATKVDVKKMFGKSPAERKKAFAEFSTIRTQSPVGFLAPDFELITTTGETVRLSDKRGSIAVFMFVAMTCPPARTQVNLWKNLHEQYNTDGVEVFFVYSRERHAGERGYPDFKETKTTSERMVYAKMLSEITAVPVVVDPIDEPTLKDYGVVPNAAFVVDREGFIVFKSQWADARKIEKVVQQLLILEGLNKQTNVGSR
ncbi:MAG: hypothetical protein CMD78_07215 [Gammaproteobacteria bacterium]|nr:hypothetical protein [Gammaproteobacteria bacterium]|tara:strand:- start:3538 stop:4368 length:831 start_codon:yes stop_codon:yes gene_type:complete